MNTSEYLSLMRERLTAAFDFRDSPEGLSKKPDLWAVHNRTSEKYFLSKSISLYTVNNDEYVGLYGCKDKIKEADIDLVFDQFKRLIKELPTDEKHMSSIFTAALISEHEIDPKVIEAASVKKFHKDFRFTLRGWADFALILVDLSSGKIYSNAFGKKMMKNYALPKEQ